MHNKGTTVNLESYKGNWGTLVIRIQQFSGMVKEIIYL